MRRTYAQSHRNFVPLCGCPKHSGVAGQVRRHRLYGSVSIDPSDQVCAADTRDCRYHAFIPGRATQSAANDQIVTCCLDWSFLLRYDTAMSCVWSLASVASELPSGRCRVRLRLASVSRITSIYVFNNWAQHWFPSSSVRAE